jgi:CHAT domain-containing protein
MRFGILIIAIGCVTLACSKNGDRPAVPAKINQPVTSGNDPPAKLDSLSAKGESSYARGEFDSARTFFRTALAGARVAHDSTLESRSLTWLGLAAYRQGKYREARTLGEQALALKLRAGLKADLFKSYNALGLLAWNEGRLDDAIALFERATESARANADQPSLAKAANNIALVYTELGNFAQARSGFMEARKAGHLLGDAKIEGRSLDNLGMLDVQLGDPRSAVTELSEARALLRTSGDVTGEQNVLGQLGAAYDALGEPRLAFAALDTALELSRSQGLKQEEASNLELIAGIQLQAGETHQALKMYQQAGALDAELGLEIERGTNLRNIAQIYFALGGKALALANVNAALKTHRAAHAPLQEMRDLLVLADLESEGKSSDPAVAQHLAAAERLAHGLNARIPRVELALTTGAIADREGNPRKVLRTLQNRESDLARGGYGDESQAAMLKARSYARLDLLDSAAEAGREAVAAVERVRGNFGSTFLRASYATDKADAYADLVDILLRLGRIDEAFQIADEARSRALLEHLAATANGASSSNRTIRSLAESEAMLRRIDTLASHLDAIEETPVGKRDAQAAARIKLLAAQLTEARSSYEGLIIEVAERDAAGSALLGGRRTAPEEVKRAIGPDEALLEYWITQNRLIVFVIANNGIRSLATEIRRDDLTRRIRLARDLLGGTDVTAGDESAVLAGLYQLLIAPAERAGLLRRVRRLLVIPHSALAYLPFAALRNGATGRYLAEDYSTVNFPSAASLVSLRSTASGLVNTALASRSSVFAPFSRTLPGTVREARIFRSAFHGAASHENASATERQLREALSAGGIVHVAGHGVMNPRNPMFSRIEMAQGSGSPEDDGRLEVHELLTMRIHAPLVFLSGCETGVASAWSTEFSNGEDYSTLAQGFMYAGAQSVIATLWRIQDEGAAALAERFYGNLKEMAAPEALATAQRDLLRGSPYQRPYYWAGYTLTGVSEGASRAQKSDGVR